MYRGRSKRMHRNRGACSTCGTRARRARADGAIRRALARRRCFLQASSADLGSCSARRRCSATQSGGSDAIPRQRAARRQREGASESVRGLGVSFCLLLMHMFCFVFSFALRFVIVVLCIVVDAVQLWKSRLHLAMGMHSQWVLIYFQILVLVWK